jgi:hypothetical protein
MGLPADTCHRPCVAESLAASPVDANVVALSLASDGLSPRHAAVMLVRELVGMPLRTQGHTGANVIVFSSDGQSPYGLNSETAESGLRRIEVLADGLLQQQVLSNAVGQFGPRRPRGDAVGWRCRLRGTQDDDDSPPRLARGAARLWKTRSPASKLYSTGAWARTWLYPLRSSSDWHLVLAGTVVAQKPVR